jgi:hypothetical protein
LGVSTVRLIKHEAVPKCGSFEVRFSDGTPSRSVIGEYKIAVPADAGMWRIAFIGDEPLTNFWQCLRSGRFAMRLHVWFLISLAGLS